MSPRSSSVMEKNKTNLTKRQKPSLDEERLVGDALVLFFDILGVSDLLSDQIDIKRNVLNIGTLYNVLDSIRKKLDIRHRNGVTVPGALASAMFSDSVYIVSATGAKPTDFESELYGHFFIASECQTILLEHGFIARGGIAGGIVAVEDNFIAGPACVSAAAFDKHGKPPVIMIDKKLIWDSYRGSCDMKCSAHNPDFYLFDDSWRYKLLYDTKSDTFFFNYMEDWFALCTDPLSDGDPECYNLLVYNLKKHRQLIAAKISEIYKKSQKDEKDAKILEKYLFLANLHNFVLRTFAESQEFAHIDKYALQQPLPPTSIAWAYPYLKKFIMEESCKYDMRTYDADFLHEAESIAQGHTEAKRRLPNFEQTDNN